MMNWLGETLPSCDVFLGDPSWQSCPVLKGSSSVGQIGCKWRNKASQQEPQRQRNYFLIKLQREGR